MTDIASGVAKRVAYKAETTWNTAAGSSSGQYIRRVSSNLGLRKRAYESQEMRRDYQRADYRHGVKSVDGSINGELSPGTYEDFIAAAVRKAFVAVSDITGLSITIATSGSYYTVTRGSGSFITDGIKTGNVVRLTAGSFTTGNLNNNLFVLSMTASALTVTPLNGSTLTAEGPISSATLAVPGKKTYIPTSGHTDTSFSIEHWFSDISQSELFTGCKVNGMSIGLPASGLVTCNFDFLGAGLTTGTSEYYSSPTAELTTGGLAAVNGVLMAQGGAVALLTGLTINLRGNMSGAEVVGSNSYAAIVEGRALVDGQVTAYFQDATIRDYFLNETEVALAAALTTSPAKNADFMAFVLPRVKFGGGAPDDGEKGLVLTMPFTGLLNTSGGSGTATEQTSFAVQDSQA